MASLDELYPPSPGLWKLGAAAKMARLTPRQLANACAGGHIPVRLVVLGAKSRFVVADELRSWLATFDGQLPETAANLNESLF